MDKRELEEICKRSAMDALDALCEASDEITGAKGQLSSDDIYDLKCIWSAISHVKTSMAMDEGGNALRRIMR